MSMSWASHPQTPPSTEEAALLLALWPFWPRCTGGGGKAATLLQLSDGDWRPAWLACGDAWKRIVIKLTVLYGRLLCQHCVCGKATSRVLTIGQGVQASPAGVGGERESWCLVSGPSARLMLPRLLTITAVLGLVP